MRGSPRRSDATNGSSGNESIKQGLWYRAIWEEEQATTGDDVYPWGIAKNVIAIEKMLDYACAQGLTPNRLDLETLFHVSLLDT